MPQIAVATANLQRVVQRQKRPFQFCRCRNDFFFFFSVQNCLPLWQLLKKRCRCRIKSAFVQRAVCNENKLWLQLASCGNYHQMMTVTHKSADIHGSRVETGLVAREISQQALLDAFHKTFLRYSCVLSSFSFFLRFLNCLANFLVSANQQRIAVARAVYICIFSIRKSASEVNCLRV